MYNNIGKRDILIFPTFPNINIINDIRNKYDKLAEILPPHITLAFPFRDAISNEDLINKVSSVLKDFSSFEVTFKGVFLSHDNYILLNCIKGAETLIRLHDELYEKVIPTHLNKSITYIPHITLGQADNLNDFKDFDEEFTGIIDKVSIELIGEHEESIIIENFDL